MQQEMTRYVEQLMEDMDAIKRIAQERLTILSGLEDWEGYFPMDDDADEGGIKVSDLIGLEMYIFPKSSFLKEHEASLLANKMEELWQAFGLNPIFATCLPADLKYEQLRHSLGHAVYPVIGNTVDLELCDYLPQHCPFADLCPALRNSSAECCKLNRV